ncbi:hypothetical protein ABPG73_017048 [Tetrahymena malaccensis]
MIYSKLDLFSSQFQFGISGQQKKKGTLFGTLFQANLASEGGVAKETHLEKLYQNNQREFVDENPGEVDEQKPEEEKSQICVPAFCNRQKMSLDIEQSSNCISPTNFDSPQRKKHQGNEFESLKQNIRLNQQRFGHSQLIQRYPISKEGCHVDAHQRLTSCLITYRMFFEFFRY